MWSGECIKRAKYNNANFQNVDTNDSDSFSLFLH